MYNRNINLYSQKMTAFWDDAPCSLLKFYQTTRHYISGDSHLHTRRRENLKSRLKTKINVSWLCAYLQACAGFVFRNISYLHLLNRIYAFFSASFLTLTHL
jgi:hypothetical protein